MPDNAEIVLQKKKALDFLGELDSGSVDLVLTDPPYNVGKKYDGYNDDLEEQEYWDWMQEIVNESERVLSDSGFLAIVTPDPQKLKWLKMLDSSDLERKNTIYWCRPNVFGFRHSGFSQNVYPIYIMGSADATFSSGDEVPRSAGINNFNYIEEPSPQSNFEEEKRVHPAQQPIGVYEKILLKCSSRNDRVVDPFLGSGTSAVVAKKWNRNFVGSDISSEYLEKARERVAKTSKEKLFEQQRLGE